KLKEFCEAHPDAVELHAAGHSAGSIFHTHLLPLALKLGVPAFRSVHFLAPAVRVDTFKQLLLPKLGSGVDELTIYTMTKDWERDDNTGGVYRKSLLYLVSSAFELDKNAPILGLEESIRADEAVRKALGLGGSAQGRGSVVWSVSAAESGLSASRSTSHGGFDDDAHTMNSMLRRILGNESGPIAEYGVERGWADREDWHIYFEAPGLAASVDTTSFDLNEPVQNGRPASAAKSWADGQAKKPATIPSGPGRVSGRRRALCVGIDEYARSPLAGCVADARDWKRTLEGLGFTVAMLTNHQATRSGILAELSRLVESSEAGDVLVFQYAGHGTTARDLDGDEANGDTAGFDEALCPIDLDSGALLIDDDIAEVFAKLPNGVNLTCFIDCCHSGTITRFAVGPPQRDGRGGDQRVRCLVMTPELDKAHAEFRRSLGLSRGRSAQGPKTMREVVFSACLSSEVAWESEGHGDFTTRATKLLANGVDGMTHEEFQQKVVEAFGDSPRQHPVLDCAPAARRQPFLKALAGAAPSRGQAADQPAGEPAYNGQPEIAAIAQGFRLIADLLENGR
ncbi:MAG: caspase family protein, partial [Bryobacteraceae bacterium]